MNRDDKIKSATELLNKSIAMARLGIISSKELKKNINTIREQIGYKPLKKIKLFGKFPIK